jgi:hypothetical protein
MLEVPFLDIATLFVVLAVIKRPKMLKVVLSVLFLLGLAGCATFKPEWKYQDLVNAHRPEAMEAHNGLEISIEKTSAEKSKKIFDSDLQSNGVLPIFIKATNKSPGAFRVFATQTKANAGGELLPVLRGVDAAETAGNRDVAGKAALWGLAGGPFFFATAIGVSGMHSSSVNREIEHHFDNLEFADSTLQPNQVIGGFIYLKFPENIKQAQNLTIEIPASEEKTGAQMVFKFSLKP